ncbi:MAG: DUF262 domain-containing protein [Phycisphaerae bacterium]
MEKEAFVGHNIEHRPDSGRSADKQQDRADSVSLAEIAEWQLDPRKAMLKVGLPKLQRGFVWKPSKVINLWDSILRGFPIGSLLLSKIGDIDSSQVKSDQYWLLDGQQRATSP